MLSFDIPKYEKVLGNAIALRPQVEKAADEISKVGYSNIFFIGSGGSYAHGLCLKYMMDTQSTVEIHAVTAAEFMLMNHKRFSKDSLCVFTTRSGDTKEIVAAAKYCRDAGARVVMYSAKTDSPAAQHADYLLPCYSDDDYLVEVIYLIMVPFIARLMQQRGEFPKYDKLVAGTDSIIPYLIKGKEILDEKGRTYAAAHKDCDYTMVVGSGTGWGEAYSAAMCIMEEMLWMKTKSIHAAEFFHGTIELVEADTTMLLFYGDDGARPPDESRPEFRQHGQQGHHGGRHKRHRPACGCGFAQVSSPRSRWPSSLTDLLSIFPMNAITPSLSADITAR